MGVNSLWDIVSPTARPVRLEALSRKKLAVDASIWIYQFLKAVRDQDGNALPQSHIVGFFRRICKLLYFGILPIFVFDGGAPALKRHTILQRKQRRQGKTETTRETAQKLLSMHIQRQAELARSRPRARTNNGKTNDEYNEDDIVFYEDLPTQFGKEPNEAEQQQQNSFLKKDEYHLPDLKSFKVSTDDSRIMPDEEFQESMADFDYVDGIDITTVDPNSDEFLKLPISTQYMILSHLRLKSRLRMGYRKDQLEALFPNSMDFSKFQIQQVQKRNFYTQKLMTVAGFGEDGNATRRVAGDKDRKYALVRSENGWTLSLGETSALNPITLDEDGNEIYVPEPVEEPEAKPELKPEPEMKVEEPEEDSDFEDVPLEAKEETVEEKAYQKALIESIYDQYEPKKEESPVVSAQALPFSTDGFNDEQLRQAIEDSKKDLLSLQRKEGEMKDKIDAGDDFDLGLSFLFGNTKEKDTKETKKDTKEDTREDKKENKIEQKKDSVTFKKPENKKNDKKQLHEKPHTPKRTEKQPIQEDKIPDVNIQEGSPSLVNDCPIEIEDEPETEPEKKDQSIPSWFNEDIELNLHNNPLFEFENRQNQYKEDEEAGLISWTEAKDMLGQEQEEEEHESDGDIQEIAAPAPIPEEKAEQVVEKEEEARKAEVLDYDFEEEEENQLVSQLLLEERDHELFKTQIRQTHEIPLASVNTSVTEEQMLQEKLQKAKRDSDEVTQAMVSDVQELLRRFGIPFITAPMEAEAQCAELRQLGLVDGIITDDSDCFLFGGDLVYKNMFNQKQFVECYIMSEIEHKVGLNQEKLIELALLLGSDYTEGIKGIGPVLAMEILAEFETLERFKKWYDDNNALLQSDNLTGLKKTLLARIKKGKLFIPDTFPDRIVFEAYTHPDVDHDRSAFKWGVPSLDQIRSFLMYNVGWSQGRVDEVMVPLIRDMNRKKAEGTQSTLGEFFPQEYILSRDIGLGKRMKTAASKLNKTKRNKH